MPGGLLLVVVFTGVAWRYWAYGASVGVRRGFEFERESELGLGDGEALEVAVTACERFFREEAPGIDV